jgi:hypothetical protein
MTTVRCLLLLMVVASAPDVIHQPLRRSAPEHAIFVLDRRISRAYRRYRNILLRSSRGPAPSPKQPTRAVRGLPRQVSRSQEGVPVERALLLGRPFSGHSARVAVRVCDGRTAQTALMRLESRAGATEFGRELFGDAVSQRVGEHQHMHVPLVVCLYVGGPVLF